MSTQPGQSIMDLSRDICREVFKRDGRDQATMRYLREIHPHGLGIAQTVKDGYVLATGVTKDGIVVLADLALALSVLTVVSTEDRMRAPNRP